MGTIYMVACTRCKVTRDLSKFYYVAYGYPLKDRAEALEFSERVEKGAFQAGLLVSFMGEHQGHDCVFFSEHSEREGDLDPFYDHNEYREDTDFWSEDG